MGQPSCMPPPLPGVTPATTFVPYAAACRAWNVPSLPVSPCTIRRVDLSSKTAMVQSGDVLAGAVREPPYLVSGCELHHLARRLVHRVGGGEVHPARTQQPLPFLDV